MNTPKRQKKVDIVTGSTKVREAIIERKSELNLKNSDIIKEAVRCGIKGLTKTTLSIYFNNPRPVMGYPTQRHIIFMCLRYGISVGIQVKKLDIKKIGDERFKQYAERFAEETSE